MLGTKQSLLQSYFAKELALAVEETQVDQQEADCQLNASQLGQQAVSNKTNQGTFSTEKVAVPPSPTTKTKAPYNRLSDITKAAYLEWALHQMSDQTSHGRGKGPKVALSAHLGSAGLEREASAFLATLGKASIKMCGLS